jgi:hypothetical protein
MFKRIVRRWVVGFGLAVAGTTAAVAMVGHDHLPQGTVTVEYLGPVEVAAAAPADLLGEVVITATRLPALAEDGVLAEVVVTAKRLPVLVAAAAGPDVGGAAEAALLN